MDHRQVHSTRYQVPRKDWTAEILSVLFGSAEEVLIDRVSDAEIAQLVSVALDLALSVLAQPDPEELLRSRARVARAEIQELFLSLPRTQRADQTVLAEYRKSLAFQKLSTDLALNLIDVIGRYAEVCERGSSSDAA